MESGTYRIGLTGSRNWKLEAPIRRALRSTVADVLQLGLHPVLIHGNCPTGADRIADRIWRDWRWEPEIHNADWDSCGPTCPNRPHRVKRWSGDRHHPGTLEDWCPGAGPRRNQRMIETGLDILLAFPLGERSGTQNCIRQARQAGILVSLPDQWG